MENPFTDDETHEPQTVACGRCKWVGEDWELQEEYKDDDRYIEFSCPNCGLSFHFINQD